MKNNLIRTITVSWAIISALIIGYLLIDNSFKIKPGECFINNRDGSYSRVDNIKNDNIIEYTNITINSSGNYDRDQDSFIARYDKVDCQIYRDTQAIFNEFSALKRDIDLLIKYKMDKK